MQCRKAVYEESPGITGQGAGEIPVEATLRKVQQKNTAGMVLPDDKIHEVKGNSE